MYDIPLDRAYLLALWLESYLFGTYTILFLIALYLLLRVKHSSVNWMALIPLIVLYTLATTHVTITLFRSIQGFIVQGGQQLGGATEYFLEASNPLNVANLFIYVTCNLVADGLLIFRCYVIRARSRKAILYLLCLCTAVTGYNAVYQFHLSKRGTFNQSLEKWAKAFLCCSLATNVLITGLIAGYMLARGSAVGWSVGLPSPLFWNVSVICIESGALYSSALVIAIALFVTQTNAICVIFDGMAQVACIVPTMIFVLVSSEVSRAETIAGTSDSTHFHSQRSNLLNTRSHIPRHQGMQPHTHPEGDLDLDNLPTARAIPLPSGDDRPLGKEGHSLGVAFGGQGVESSRSGAAIGGRLSEDQPRRKSQPQTT